MVTLVNDANMPDFRIRNIPLDAYKQLKHIAVERELTINELMLELIMKEVAKSKGKP